MVSKGTQKEAIKTLEDLERKYLKKYPPPKHRYVPSGSISLDYLLGGGLPLGRVMLMTSAPSLGKSLCAMYMSASLLKNTEGVVLYLDIEKGISESLVNSMIAREIRSRFVLMSPNSYEDVQEIIEDYMQTNKLVGVFIDSITSLYPKSVFEDGRKPLGMKAAMESLFCLKCKVYSAMHNFLVVYVNQQRVMDIASPLRTAPAPAGGWALKHYNDIMMSMYPLAYIRSKTGDKIGAQVKMVTEKNKLVGNRTVVAFLRYGHGISNVATVIAILKHKGFVRQKATFFDVLIEGLQLKETVRGNRGLEEFVSKHFEAIVDYVEKESFVEDYFTSFRGEKNSVVE